MYDRQQTFSIRKSFFQSLFIEISTLIVGFILVFHFSNGEFFVWTDNPLVGYYVTLTVIFLPIIYASIYLRKSDHFLIVVLTSVFIVAITLLSIGSITLWYMHSFHPDQMISPFKTIDGNTAPLNLLVEMIIIITIIRISVPLACVEFAKHQFSFENKRLTAAFASFSVTGILWLIITGTNSTIDWNYWYLFFILPGISFLLSLAFRYYWKLIVFAIILLEVYVAFWSYGFQLTT